MSNADTVKVTYFLRSKDNPRKGRRYVTNVNLSHGKGAGMINDKDIVKKVLANKYGRTVDDIVIESLIPLTEIPWHKR